MAKETFTHAAILIRGTVYVHQSKQYHHNVPVPVTEDVKAYLEENAIDIATVSDGDEIERPKFRFEELDAEEEAPSRKRPGAATT